MSIRENIQEISERVADERDNNPPSQTALHLHKLATNAILGGPEDWVNYMKYFAKTPEELARLIPLEPDPEDPVEREKLRSARAYLAANGMCTEMTTPHTDLRVTDDLNVPQQ